MINIFRHRAIALLAGLAIAAALAGCGGSSVKIPKLPGDAVVLAFGDSLTFGTGATPDKSYPALLERKIGLKVIAAGIPGEVSAAGLARLPEVLDEVKPKLLILCHGGNDLLRKLSIKQAGDNIRAMIGMARSRGMEVVLLGVPSPGLFLSTADLYDDIAREMKLAYEGKAIAKIWRTEGEPIAPQWHDIYTLRIPWNKGYMEVECSKPDEAFPSVRTKCGKALVEYSGECNLKVSQFVGVQNDRNPVTGKISHRIEEYYKAVEVKAELNEATVSCSPENPCGGCGQKTSVFPSVMYHVKGMLRKACQEEGEDELRRLNRALEIRQRDTSLVGPFIGWLSGERNEITTRAESGSPYATDFQDGW